MGAFKHYFNYKMLCLGCGVPYVVLDGTAEDYKKILEKAKKLKKYDSYKLKRELTYIWILKTLRRIKQCGKFDMVLSNYFKIWQFDVIVYFIYNCVKKKGYSYKLDL